VILARAFLWSVAAVFIGFGLWGLLEPRAMVAEFGVSLGGPDGATMIRASYGGFLIGEGLLFAWCALAPARIRFGLVAVALLTAPILLSRLLGMAVDGSSSPYHLAYGGIELIGVSVALFFLQRTGPA
jgi:nitrate reductase gamma subunit